MTKLQAPDCNVGKNILDSCEFCQVDFAASVNPGDLFAVSGAVGLVHARVPQTFSYLSLGSMSHHRVLRQPSVFPSLLP
jgi:hypothetical protein